MSYISVPYTCTYIDEMLSELNEMRSMIEDEMEKDEEGSSVFTEMLGRMDNVDTLSEIIRDTNVTLREEGEIAAEDAVNYERQVEIWQDVANRGAERILRMEDELAVFDAEKERVLWPRHGR